MEKALFAKKLTRFATQSVKLAVLSTTAENTVTESGVLSIRINLCVNTTASTVAAGTQHILNRIMQKIPRVKD